jgi:uncharacterized membrane protein (Fun14 family)
MVFEIGGLMTGLAGGGAVGAVAGFAGKKLANVAKTIILVLAGVQFAVFAAAEYYGLIDVDWAGFQNGLVEFMGVASSKAANVAPPVMDTLLATAPVSGGFLGGFLLGFKFG